MWGAREIIGRLLDREIFGEKDRKIHNEPVDAKKHGHHDCELEDKKEQQLAECRDEEEWHPHDDEPDAAAAAAVEQQLQRQGLPA